MTAYAIAVLLSLWAPEPVVDSVSDACKNWPARDVGSDEWREACGLPPVKLPTEQDWIEIRAKVEQRPSADDWLIVQHFDGSGSCVIKDGVCEGDQKCCTDEGYPPQRACPEPRPCPPCRCECKCPEVPAVRWNEDCDKELERLREEATK